VDLDTGAISAHYEYDPFGRLVCKEGVYADENEYRFSTKRYNAAWGLYDYGYRHYSPDLGRWMSMDPIRERGGVNLYAGMMNNHLSFIDPIGLANQKRECRITIYVGHLFGNRDANSQISDNDQQAAVARGEVEEGHKPDDMEEWSAKETRDKADDKSDACAFLSCYADVYNSKIPSNRRINKTPKLPGLNNTETLAKALSWLIFNAIETAPKWCDDQSKCCSTVKIQVKRGFNKTGQPGHPQDILDNSEFGDMLNESVKNENRANFTLDCQTKQWNPQLKDDPGGLADIKPVRTTRKTKDGKDVYEQQVIWNNEGREYEQSQEFYK
jgi:RHS repeat-associated protein